MMTYLKKENQFEIETSLNNVGTHEKDLEDFKSLRNIFIKFSKIEKFLV